MNETEHWVPDDADAFEARVGVRYCRRCGRPIRRTDGTGMTGASKPCDPVKIGLREATADV